MTTIRAAIEAAIAYLSSNPTDARSTDSLASARLLDGLRVETQDADGRGVTTDMVPSVGGANTAPSPDWLLRAALASCVTTLIAMRAAQQDVTLTAVEVDVDSESDDLGILGIDQSVPAGPLSVRVAARVSGEPREDVVAEIVGWAVDHCPVVDALRRSVPVSVETTSR